MNQEKKLTENETIRPIAEKYGKTIPQIIFKWLLQQDIIIIPKTWNPKYLKQNISLYDFTLDDTEMALIDSLDKGHFLNYNPYNAFRGLPRKYKSWDGFK